ncbi:hypothetical protein D3C86_1361050 [compost metagenome]
MGYLLLQLNQGLQVKLRALVRSNDLVRHGTTSDELTAVLPCHIDNHVVILLIELLEGLRYIVPLLDERDGRLDVVFLAGRIPLSRRTLEVSIYQHDIKTAHRKGNGNVHRCGGLPCPTFVATNNSNHISMLPRNCIDASRNAAIY